MEMYERLLVMTIATTGIVLGIDYLGKKMNPVEEPRHRVTYTAFSDSEHRPYVVEIVNTWKQGAAPLESPERTDITIKATERIAGIDEIFASYEKHDGRNKLRALRMSSPETYCGNDIKPVCSVDNNARAMELIEILRRVRTDERAVFSFDDRYVTPMPDGRREPVLPGERVEGEKGYAHIGARTYTR